MRDIQYIGTINHIDTLRICTFDEGTTHYAYVNNDRMSFEEIMEAYIYNAELTQDQIDDTHYWLCEYNIT